MCNRNLIRIYGIEGKITLPQATRTRWGRPWRACGPACTRGGRCCRGALQVGPVICIAEEYLALRLSS